MFVAFLFMPRGKMLSGGRHRLMFYPPQPPDDERKPTMPLLFSVSQKGACVRFSLPLSYSEFLSHGNGAAERYAVVLVDRFNAHAVALRNGVEGIAGTYGVVRVFQHTGGFFPFLFLARRLPATDALLFFIVYIQGMIPPCRNVIIIA